MVNKPKPANYTNFRTYANAVRAWYLNKPLNYSTNTLTLFTNALQNFFRERGGPSNQQNMINREVEKLYKRYDEIGKQWALPPNERRPNFYAREGQMEHKLRKPSTRPAFLGLNVSTNKQIVKNEVRRRAMNEIAVGQFMKAFGNSKYNTIRNALLKAMRKAWTNTGKTVTGMGGNRKILRKPSGNTTFLLNNKWTPYVPINLTTFRNANGSIWVFVDGKWYKVQTKK